LLDAIRRNIDDCSKKGLFANPPITELTAEVKMKKGTKQEDEEPSDEAADQ
jgi:hypothetical protein